jgi:hypothetical protein
MIDHLNVGLREPLQQPLMANLCRLSVYSEGR